MSLRIQRISLTDNRHEIIGILARNFGDGQDTRFEWRHLCNPAGEAQAWFAFNRNNAVIGTVAVFPRRMWVDGKLLLCGQVGGFAIDTAYRCLGPAVLLQQATFVLVNSGALAFCYDCPPHDRGMSTFLRLGMQPNCEIVRHVLILQSNEYLEKHLGKRIWTTPLTGGVNFLLGLRRATRPLPGLEIGEYTGTFHDEFSRLDQNVSSTGLIRASRSAELLNWRYRQNPGWSDCEVLVARQKGELLGFLVLWVSNNRAYILDLFSLQLLVVGPALLEAAIDRCNHRNVGSLHGFCSNESELRPTLLRMGFRSRERNARVVAYEKPSCTSSKILQYYLRWNFTNVEEMG